MIEQLGPSRRPRRHDPAALLSGRYRLVLIGVALLALLNQLLVQPPLLRLMTDAPVINVAGRQRMLSQRLSKAALALEMERGEAARRRSQELADVLRAWSAAHRGLRFGDPALSLPGRNSVAVRSAFEQLEPDFDRMRLAAARIVANPASHPGALATILAAEPAYLIRMEGIVGLYEREARARVDQLLWTGWAVTGLLLVGLAAIGRMVLRPAARLIDRQVSELRQARDELESRVAERTRDLEREARERTLAEQRHRSLVEQFSHASRLNTIGEMASGLAHELNQPLGAIANYTEGCLVALDSPQPALDEVRDALRKSLTTTLRAGEIVKRIRRFVTRHDLANERIEPNRVVGEVEALFADEARRRGIRLELQLAPDLPYLYGDPVQLQQVLVNLLRNAFDALSAAEPEEPTVIMRTEACRSGAVEFSVTDNGEGIPAPRLAQIFDVYFSTRDQGMGMGLAISRTIVEAHHGRIGVESAPGIHTTFRVTLPASGDEHAGSDGLHCRR